MLEELGHPLRVHLPVVRLRVDEHRPRAGVADRVGGRDEGERRDQHLVVRLDAGDEQRDVQRRGAVDGGHREARRRRARPAPLEPVDVRADRRDPAGVEAFLDVAPLVPADLRARTAARRSELNCGTSRSVQSRRRVDADTRSGHLGDALRHAAGYPEAELIGDLREGDAVVARVLGLVHVLDDRVGGMRADELHELLLLIVLVRRADVEDLAADTSSGASSTVTTARAASRTWT